MPVPYIPTDTRVLSTANGAVVGQLQNQIMDIGRPDSRYSNRSRDRRSRSRSRYEFITCFHEFWIYESTIFFTIFFSLTYVLGRSTIWMCWILNLNVCLFFFPLRQPAENNNKYFIFKIRHDQMDELPKTEEIEFSNWGKNSQKEKS